jgi:hypothetical protein
MKYIGTLKANIKRGGASMSLVDILTNPTDPVFYMATAGYMSSTIEARGASGCSRNLDI